MRLSDWFDRELVVERLVTANMRQACAELAAGHFVESAAALREIGVDPSMEVTGCWVPGRVEVLGKHTDYCGGRSLLAAAERGFCMLAVPQSSNTAQIVDAQRMDVLQFALEETLQSQAGHWSNYAQTVARRLAKNFPGAIRGARIAFSSNLPASAGMSSSSALVVGTFMLMASISRLSRKELFQSCIDGREALAGYLGTIENGSSFGPLQGDRGVGTFGGSEDHTGILCGQPDELVLYSYCPVRFERSTAMDGKLTFAIASSGVVAEKTGAAQAKYNHVSLLAKAIVEKWRRTTKQTESSLAAILSSAPDAGNRLREMLGGATGTEFSAGELIERLDHFQIEDQLVKSVPERINPATINEFSSLVRRSQASAEQLLKNQTPETIDLVQIAIELGAHAATAFGAGFGGSVWAMIDAENASTFVARWQDKYLQRFADKAAKASFFSMRPGRPALNWNGDWDGMS